MPTTVRPIILAAGKGTRMGNPDLPKVLTPLKGRPLISYVLDTVSRCGLGRPALVVGFHAGQVREALGDAYEYVLQEEQRGTGHAIKVCRAQLEGSAAAYVVMYGDQPFVSEESLRGIVSRHEADGAALTLATLNTDHATFDNFGRILRDGAGAVSAIRERKDCTPEEAAIAEYNVGLYCFSDAWLWDALERITPANAQGEYYLTDLLGIAVSEGVTVSSVEIADWHESLGVNTPEQLAEAEQHV